MDAGEGTNSPIFSWGLTAMNDLTGKVATLKQAYPKKFVAEDKVFKNIRRGDKIFVGTGCGQPQFLVQALVNYVETHPDAFFDTEVIHLWTLGIAPYTDQRFRHYFRHVSMFVSNSTRAAVNEGLADYTPIFLFQVPELLYRRLAPIDVALIQTSPPDDHGYLSLGISVDITKAAIETADIVIAQVNANMPRIHGDGFVHIEEIDYIIPHDEPILELKAEVDNEVIEEIGHFVSSLIQNGDTIQVGYGRIPNAILAKLAKKQQLGVHTGLLTDGIVPLMKRGVIDNSRKSHNRGRTVATFAMGSKETYEYLHDNPKVEFRTVDYTNNPLVIARHDNMTAINSALQIDLTGQSTSESIDHLFFSGIGGQADFMRGAVLARNGKTILTLPSTAENEEFSRIVPFLKEGAGVTFNRGDIHYVVTEYGIAYLHGKSIRERAMELIAIAHPKFKPWLIDEAKKLKLIYKDQAFIPGEAGVYPVEMETYRTTRSGLEIFLRPVKISDEPLLKDFFYSLSDESLRRRFMGTLKSMPHERLQDFVIIDYTRDIVILAVLKQNEELEAVIGIGQYNIDELAHMADVAFAVGDDYQGKGVGTELLNYLTYLAKRRGLLGFTADVLADNWHMLRLFEKMGFDIRKRLDAGTYELKMTFKRDVSKP
jgi:acyl-CoA hydrolase/GNAT superfamily N-acetyltransferase